MTSKPLVARVTSLAEAAAKGDRRALARVLTEVENGTASGQIALSTLYPRAGRAHLIGVTGPPGSGKSTLVGELVRHVRASQRQVAVLAIDPSSPITGGAILGDRVRMQEFASDPGVFIRSMAARGHLGGLAMTTLAATTVLDAAGFPLIFIETVGTGQSEVEIAAVADTTIVVQAPEMGDEVQAIKAGLLEIADLVVVTKGDRPGADRAVTNLRGMLTVGAQHDRAREARSRPKRPQVLLVSSVTGEGVPELLASLDRRYEARSSDAAAERAHDATRLERAEAQVLEVVTERLRDGLSGPDRTAAITDLLAAVAARELDPYAAAGRAIELLLRAALDESASESSAGARDAGPDRTPDGPST